MPPSDKQEGTRYTDTATGLKVEILQGQGNYTRWYRDVRLAAQCEDVWTLISSADLEVEEILTKPTRPTKPGAANAKYQRACGDTDDVTTSEQELFCFDLNTYEVETLEYELDVDAYIKQQKRVRDARTFLLSTVNPAIRVSISSKTTPRECMDHIKRLYKMTDSLALALTYRSIDEMKYSDHTGVSDVIYTLKTYQQEIVALGGTYADEQVVSKVLTLLPEDFKDFPRRWDMLSRLNALPLNVPTLHSRLLDEEATLKSKGKLKNKADGDQRKGKGGKKKHDAALHECKWCKKMVLHKEQNCWHNPANEGKKKGTSDKTEKKQVTMATVEADNVESIINDIKGGLAVSVFVDDLDHFEDLLQKARIDPNQTKNPNNFARLAKLPTNGDGHPRTSKLPTYSDHPIDPES